MTWMWQPPKSQYFSDFKVSDDLKYSTNCGHWLRSLESFLQNQGDGYMESSYFSYSVKIIEKITIGFIAHSPTNTHLKKHAIELNSFGVYCQQKNDTKIIYNR